MNDTVEISLELARGLLDDLDMIEKILVSLRSLMRMKGDTECFALVTIHRKELQEFIDQLEAGR